MIEDTWRFIDTWVNDVVYEHWPEIFKAHHKNTVEIVNTSARHGEWEMFEWPFIPFSVAQLMADAERHSLTSPPLHYQSVLSRTPPKLRKKITALKDLCISLPRLSHKKENDLQLLQTSLNQVATIFEYPLRPRFIEEDGQTVWEF